MEFYGLVRVGPKNLFSRRAAKKATQEAATSEQKKNMKKSKKSSGEKCTNHTPLLRGGGGVCRQGRILGLASGTGHTQSRRRKGAVRLGSNALKIPQQALKKGVSFSQI